MLLVNQLQYIHLLLSIFPYKLLCKKDNCMSFWSLKFVVPVIAKYTHEFRGLPDILYTLYIFNVHDVDLVLSTIKGRLCWIFLVMYICFLYCTLKYVK